MHEAHEPGANPNAHFMAGDVRQPAADGARFGRGFTISAVTHVVAFVLVVFIAARLPEPAPSVPPERPPSEIVWIYQPGPGGGGGGGGDQSPEPPRVAEQPGREKITVPVAKPPPPAPATTRAPEA